MISITEKKKCCGCTACSSICPKKAIDMVEDEEGFLYPRVDVEKCVNCGLCDKVCPVINKYQNGIIGNINIYGCQNMNDDIRKMSTSGGMFYVLANKVIENDGIVYATGFDENSNIYHLKAENQRDLIGMCGSKYVQSNLSDVFLKIKIDLQNNKTVFFIGTPCQVEGLLKYIDDKYKKYLYTTDLVCYGVPSPGLYRKWIEYLEKKYSCKVTNINFRDKKYGYSGTNIKIFLSNGEIIEDCRDAKTFLKSMFSHLGLRPSCYDCIFRDKAKSCDFTLGDIWDIYKYSKEMDDNKGTTLVTINTKRGMDFFNTISEDNIKKIFITKIDKENVNTYYKNKWKKIKIPKRREEFFKDVNKISYKDLVDKYFPTSKKDFIANNIKPLFIKLPFSKQIIKKMRMRKIEKGN